MNEIWVPSEFSRDVFVNSGVIAEKIRVVPEGVNTTWFDPALYLPAVVPTGNLVFGAEPSQQQFDSLLNGQPTYRFLSSFKWEPRKGWDVLLEAYLTEFTSDDNVELYVITKPFVGGANFKQYMHHWAKRALKKKDAEFNASLFPRIYVIHQHINDSELPRYFKAADAFVLPSRGEGWGRPHVEAMSMGLPIISTNWSGITAYLDDTVGYPISVDSLVTVNDNSVWWFKGLKWAQPSVTHLKQLMRRVYTHREEAAAKGVLARERMVKKFSPEVLARTIEAELRRIDDLIPSFELS